MQPDTNAFIPINREEPPLTPEIPHHLEATMPMEGALLSRKNFTGEFLEKKAQEHSKNIFQKTAEFFQSFFTKGDDNSIEEIDAMILHFHHAIMELRKEKDKKVKEKYQKHKR